MAELEFRDFTILASSEWKGIEVYNSEGNVASLGNDTGDFRMTDVHYATADELEQIAAKLRELNGDPNTRALDERVKEFNRILIAALESDNARFVELTFRGIDYAQEKLEELFPEFKEKLESEDGEAGTCIHGVPDNAGYCPRCDEENRSDPA